MATVRELIQGAYREENLIPVGADPSDAENTEGLTLFNRLWQGFLGGTMLGERLQQWPVPPVLNSPVPARFPLDPANSQVPSTVYPYPPQNVNLVCQLAGAQTIYFRYDPSPGAKMGVVNIGTTFATYPLTLDGNGYTIEGQPTLVLDSALGAPVAWFFRDDLGDWRRIETLTLDSESPLPATFDDLWTCSLALRLCARNGVEPGASTALTAKEKMGEAVARYWQTQPAAVDPYNLWSMPFQSYGVPWWNGVGW